MSPELTLRPLLSVATSVVWERGDQDRVAGANAPAFVERCDTADELPSIRFVSPELTLRPLLSVVIHGHPTRRNGVSPELTLRPLLSAPKTFRISALPMADRVAGANAPAFVERWDEDRRRPDSRRTSCRRS